MIDPALTESGRQRVVATYAWALVAGDIETQLGCRDAALDSETVAAIDAVDAQLRAALGSVASHQEVK